MGSSIKNVRTISQEAFDELVKENMEDLGMDPKEALEDAIQTLNLQGVDLSGIVTCVPGETSFKDNPVMQCLDRLEEIDSVSKYPIVSSSDYVSEIGGLFDKLIELFGIEGSGSVAIGVKNGGVQLVCSLCSKISIQFKDFLVLGFKILALFVCDVQSTEMFRSSEGAAIVARILKGGSENLDILEAGFRVVAAAAAGNEIVKESFMELKIDELILQVLNGEHKGSIQNVYDAIRVLLTPDDNRVVASQVYGYARRFAKIGIAGALVESLHAGLTSPSLVSACIALKAVAVNDEICKSIAERGGIDALLKCIDDSGKQGNRTVARTSCLLLCKLAGSDSNKSIIVEKGGMDSVIQLAARFSDDPSVLQEVMPIITVLCLRSPDNASQAIEAGAGDLVVQAMQKFPSSPQLQRNSCFMIRNLVVRNPEIRQVPFFRYTNNVLFWSFLHRIPGCQSRISEKRMRELCWRHYRNMMLLTLLSFQDMILFSLSRTLLLNNGIEEIIRKAKQSHESCKDAATDALRDLGVANYNS